MISKGSAAILATIAIIAVSLSFLSYEYTSYNSKRIEDLATSEIKSNSDLQAHDAAKIIENKFDKVTAVLRTLSTSPAILNAEVPRSFDIINLRQLSTQDITDGTFWLDRDGKLLWTSIFAANQSLIKQWQGMDLSAQPYFSEVKNTGKPYYSSIIETPTSPKVYITLPIIGTSGQPVEQTTEPDFRGVIGAGIKTQKIAEIINSDLPRTFSSQLVLLDKSGTILYSSNQSSIGRNVLTPEYLNYVYSLTAPESKSAIDSLFADLSNARSGSQDIRFVPGGIYTVSYSPVIVAGEHFLMLYVLTPHTLTSDVSALIDEQQNVSLITIAIIGAVSALMALIVITWNKRLSEQVAAKTSELKLSNASLEESNKNLKTANELLAEANERLKVNDKLQKEFVNVAAHELRTPIQPLLGAAELIESQLNEKDEMKITRVEVEMILRNAKRLERLSSDILEISRIESGMLRLNRENFSIAYIIADAVSDAKAQSHFDPDKLKIKYTPDDIFVYADKEKVTEVISNLLTNAIKFTNEGTIKITTTKEASGKFVEVAVSDTGSGIDPEIAPRLFEKFATKSDRGTGIGLYISKKIVEAHGGHITGENNPNGRGATFKFMLPLATDGMNERIVAT